MHRTIIDLLIRILVVIVTQAIATSRQHLIQLSRTSNDLLVLLKLLIKLLLHWVQTQSWILQRGVEIWWLVWSKVCKVRNRAVYLTWSLLWDINWLHRVCYAAVWLHLGRKVANVWIKWLLWVVVQVINVVHGTHMHILIRVQSVDILILDDVINSKSDKVAWLWVHEHGINADGDDVGGISNLEVSQLMPGLLRQLVYVHVLIHWVEAYVTLNTTYMMHRVYAIHARAWLIKQRMLVIPLQLKLVELICTHVAQLLAQLLILHREVLIHEHRIIIVEEIIFQIWGFFDCFWNYQLTNIVPFTLVLNQLDFTTLFLFILFIKSIHFLEFLFRFCFYLFWIRIVLLIDIS